MTGVPWSLTGYVQTLTGAAESLLADGPPVEAYLFAAVSGALAVAATLTASAILRRHRVGQAARRKLEARLAADLTSERVFLVHEDRLSPASPATDAFARELSLTAPGAEGLERIFEPDTAAALTPRLARLRGRGEAFDRPGRDVAGGAWRLVGETLGARAVLRLFPVIPCGAEAEAEAAEVAPAPAPALDLALRAEAVDASPLGVAAFDRKGRLRSANATARSLLRFEAEFVAGAPSLRAVLDGLRRSGRAPERPDYAGWRAEALADPVEVLARERIWSLPNGDALRIAAAALPAGFALFVADETAALGLERRYRVAMGARRATLEALDQGMLVIGRDGRVQMVNGAFARLWGLTLPPDALDGAGFASLDEIARQATRDAADQTAWSAVAAHLSGEAGPRRRRRLELARSDGRRLALQITPLPDGATLLACADVTDAVRAETALREKNAALQAVDELKTAFLNDISYHLRNPLNAVIGFATMLRQEMSGPISPRQREHLDKVLEASEDLRQLITDALDLGALRAGEIALNAEMVDARAALARLAPRLEQRAARAGVAIEIDLEDRRSAMAWADPTRLEHAVASAVAAMLSGAARGDRLRVSAAPTERASGADAPAPGVTVEAALARGRPRNGPSIAETGALAMSLMERLVELHGGRAALEESADAARLRLSLPGAAPKAPAAPTEDAGSAAPRPERGGALGAGGEVSVAAGPT